MRLAVALGLLSLLAIAPPARADCPAAIDCNPLAAARRDEARARQDAETGDPGGALSAADAADDAALDAIGTPGQAAAQAAAEGADDAAHEGEIEAMPPPGALGGGFGSGSGFGSPAGFGR